MRPLPHRAHRKFVDTEGWTKKTKANSKKTGDDHRYELELATGDVLSTRISHGSGSIEDPNVVAAVLREQLQVSEKDFWACVNDGTLPPRPQPPADERPGPAIDAKLLRNLLRKVGMTAADLEGITPERAVRIWTDWLTNGGET